LHDELIMNHLCKRLTDAAGFANWPSISLSHDLAKLSDFERSCRVFHASPPISAKVLWISASKRKRSASSDLVSGKSAVARSKIAFLRPDRIECAME
jgi:hypothetical protein